MKQLDEKMYEVDTYDEINSLLDIVDIRYNSIIYLGSMQDSQSGETIIKYRFGVVSIKDLNKSKNIKDLITKSLKIRDEYVKDMIIINCSKKLKSPKVK